MSRRRNPRLRTVLTRNLVGVAVVAVLLLSGVNYVFARILIDDGVESQLVGLRDSRAEAIENAVSLAQSRVSTLAVNPSVADALVEMSAQYARLDQEITPSQVEELETLYELEVLPPFIEAGANLPPVADLVPASNAGRYLQLTYIAGNPAGFDEREQLDDAGDGSGYSEAHRQWHPLLRELMQAAGGSDLLLVDAASGDVVYSTKKRIDYGTDAVDGPYSETGLGEVITGLTRVAIGDTSLSDSWFYIPTGGEPVFFLAAAVRSGSEVIGALVTEVPVGNLNAIVSGGLAWEALGLGDTGEIYIVGPDRTLRSDSRLWGEDPDEYLRRFAEQYDDQRTADLIRTVGSPVLLQQVDSEAVTAGLDGDEFIGTTTNYLGTKTLTAGGPLVLSDLDWVVIAEQATSESNATLDSYVRRILLVLAILVPLIAVLGALVARSLTRPVEELIEAADNIADGDRNTAIPDLGRNELGDLARQLELVARQLDEREQAIVAEEERITDMLVAVLPARLVERVRDGEHAIDDVFDTATVISATIDAMPEATAADQDVVLEMTERMNAEVEELMVRHEVERVRRSSGSQLFVAGLDRHDADVERAAEFAAALVQMVTRVGKEFQQETTARAGLSAGEIATGVLGGSAVAFGVWGDAAGIAGTLSSLAQPGQILADGSVPAQLGPEWDIDPSPAMPGLAEGIDAYLLRKTTPADLKP